MLKKEMARVARHKGIRKRIVGTVERPRLCVHRSSKHIYAQVIDDLKGLTLYSFSTAGKSFLKEAAKLSKAAKAQKLGEESAKLLKEKGISKIAFDRGGYKYHGRVKALAEALRKGGLEF